MRKGQVVGDPFGPFVSFAELRWLEWKHLVRDLLKQIVV